MNIDLSRSKTNSHWPQRTIEPWGLVVGPCAWRASMLNVKDAKARHDLMAYLHSHPSLMIVEPEDDAALLARVGELAKSLPVMLCMNEPDFVRRLDEQVRQRVAQLNATKVAAVIIRVEELPELKAGGILQALFTLRERGVIEQVGLEVQDARGAEWLSPQTAARVLMLPYSLADQSARYRALSLAQEMGQLCIASAPAVDVNDAQSLAFALGESERVLPVLDQKLPENWRAMTHDQVDAAWTSYQSNHPAPEKLPRSHAPE